MDGLTAKLIAKEALSADELEYGASANAVYVNLAENQRVEIDRGWSDCFPNATSLEIRAMNPAANFPEISIVDVTGFTSVACFIVENVIFCRTDKSWCPPNVETVKIKSPFEITAAIPSTTELPFLETVVIVNDDVDNLQLYVFAVSTNLVSHVALKNIHLRLMCRGDENVLTADADVVLLGDSSLIGTTKGGLNTPVSPAQLTVIDATSYAYKMVLSNRQIVNTTIRLDNTSLDWWKHYAQSADQYRYSNAFANRVIIIGDTPVTNVAEAIYACENYDGPDLGEEIEPSFECFDTKYVLKGGRRRRRQRYCRRCRCRRPGAGSRRRDTRAKRKCTYRKWRRAHRR